jgi:putative membrane protein insertion efficiency factor
MRKNPDPLVRMSVFGIRHVWHGRFGRNFNKKHGISCRFFPSCSNYAILALERYGFLKGWELSFQRIGRCNRSNTGSCIDFP